MQRPSSSAAEDVPAQPPKPLRILVVEDEAVIAVLLAEVLAAMGHDVCGVENSEEAAVIAAARCQPDLMIVDVGLRTGSGVAAVAQIIGHHFIPHIFVTGRRLSSEGLHPGAVVLQKPFDEDDLEQAMRRALRQEIGPDVH
ncbi:hypothetical protein STAQ_50120 [Allostella sp. ATCC 35155]|nr:hypothetical protein STAQ_50120 [Stella sp. ATCC 35155]